MKIPHPIRVGGIKLNEVIKGRGKGPTPHKGIGTFTFDYTGDEKGHILAKTNPAQFFTEVEDFPRNVNMRTIKFVREQVGQYNTGWYMTFTCEIQLSNEQVEKLRELNTLAKTTHQQLTETQRNKERLEAELNKTLKLYTHYYQVLSDMEYRSQV